MEIHFHDQDLASVFLEVSGGDERFAEVLLFCAYAVRQMVNLGPHEASKSLAGLLSQVPGHLAEMAGHELGGGPRLVIYQGAKGRKWFSADLRGSAFSMRPHGFGPFAIGVGYYAPTSVMLLLKYLAARRVTDEDFLAMLGVATGLCGLSVLGGRVSVTNQVQIALECARAGHQAQGRSETGAGTQGPQHSGGPNTGTVTAADSPETQQLGVDELLAFLESPGPHLHFQSLDMATRAAIERQVRVMGATLTDKCPEVVPSITDAAKAEIGRDVFTGYVVGRRALMSHEIRILYTNGKADAMAKSQQLARSSDPIPSGISETVGRLFEAIAETSTERQPYGAIRDRNLAATFVVLAMMSGFSLAHAENALAKTIAGEG